MNRRRRVAAACLGAVTLLSLSACSSKPGNRRVVSDVIESLQLPPDEEACMLAKLETYTDDQLDQIADENENWDPAEGSTMAEASEGMRLFIADFEECTEGEPPVTAPGETSVPTESSVPSESTVATGSAVETTSA